MSTPHIGNGLVRISAGMVSILLNSLQRCRGAAPPLCERNVFSSNPWELRRTGRARTGLSPTLGVLLLSALWTVASLRTDLFPLFGADILSPAQRQAGLFSVFAALAASIAQNEDYDPVNWLKYFRRAWTKVDWAGSMTRMTIPRFEMRMRYGWCKRPVSSVHATSSARSS